MAFNKILLVLAFSMSVLAISVDIPIFSLDGDTIIWDQRGYEQGILKVETEDNVHPWTGNSSSTNFSSIPYTYTKSSDFAINSIYNYEQQQTSCDGLQEYFKFLIYEHESLAVLAYYGLNIQPSVHHLLNCHPSELKTITSSTPAETTEDLSIGCDLKYDYYSIIKGISPTTCYYDEGYGGDSYNAKCQNGLDDVVTYGSSLKMGYTENYEASGLGENTLRSLIARFGPVAAFNNDDERYQVYYGWYVNPTDGHTYYQSLTRNGAGAVIINNQSISPFPQLTEAFFYYGTRQTLTPYVPSVKCTTGKFPTTDGCICDDTDTVCKAGPPVTCTGSGDRSDCICPTSSSGVATGNLPDRCPCLPSGDQRDKCQGDPTQGDQYVSFPKVRMDGTTIIWDARDQYVTVNMDTLHPWGGSKSDANFTVLPERIKITSDLAFNTRPNFAEYENSCEYRYYYYLSSVYDFWGTISLAYYNVSVIPSDLHFLNCHPRQAKSITASGQEIIEYLTPVCDQDIAEYPYLRGVVDTSCYGTTETPGAACKATCTDGSALKTFGKDLLYQYFLDYAFNEDYLKRALIAFGPILGRRQGNEYYEVFYGWKTIDGKIYYLSFVRNSNGDISFTSDSSSPFRQIEDAYIVYGARQDLSGQDPHPKGSSGSIRAALSVVAVTVVLPLLALF